ncbi:MAG: hypothetical protein V1648_02880 [Candidatus Aenigmatarchaeota archaeon]
MAEIQTIDVKRDNVFVNLKISKLEYETLSNHTSNLLLLPTSHNFMSYLLTTGKLGNSNRVMLPKKILEKFDIRILDKKVPARMFSINDDTYLLIKIKKSAFGIPVFKDGEAKE